MYQLATRNRSHPAEPTPGSFRSSSGENADLFKLSHYPIRATCRVCFQPIQAESFLRAFQHVADLA
jgi:hypothetical protein